MADQLKPRPSCLHCGNTRAEPDHHEWCEKRFKWYRYREQQGQEALELLRAYADADCDFRWVKWMGEVNALLEATDGDK